MLWLLLACQTAPPTQGEPSFSDTSTPNAGQVAVNACLENAQYLEAASVRHLNVDAPGDGTTASPVNPGTGCRTFDLPVGTWSIYGEDGPAPGLDEGCWSHAQEVEVEHGTDADRFLFFDVSANCP